MLGRFGLDSVIGLIPGVGDLSTAAISAYLVYEAKQLGVPKRTLARMLANVGFDFAVGSVPLLGDILDFAFKSNRRNVKLLEKWLERNPR